MRKTAVETIVESPLPFVGTLQYDELMLIRNAKSTCKNCQGSGRQVSAQICECLLATVFDEVFEAYGRATEPKAQGGVVLHQVPEGTSLSRPQQEFAADFEVLMWRTAVVLDGLAATGLTCKIWEFYLRHAPPEPSWKAVLEAAPLKMDTSVANRRMFFRNLYRLKVAAARVFIELQPHGLYPVARYFGGQVEA